MSNSSYTTYDLQERFKAGEPIAPEDMYDENTAQNERINLAIAIEEKFGNQTRFANKYGIAPNYLSEILNGKKKNPNRDYYLIILAAVKYDYEKSNSALRHLGLRPCSVRDPRDYLIFSGIMNGLDPYEINESIEEYNEDHPGDEIPVLFGINE